MALLGEIGAWGKVSLQVVLTPKPLKVVLLPEGARDFLPFIIVFASATDFLAQTLQ